MATSVSSPTSLAQPHNLRCSLLTTPRCLRGSCATRRRLRGLHLRRRSRRRNARISCTRWGMHLVHPFGDHDNRTQRVIDCQTPTRLLLFICFPVVMVLEGLLTRNGRIIGEQWALHLLLLFLEERFCFSAANWTLSRSGVASDLQISQAQPSLRATSHVNTLWWMSSTCR